MMSLRSWTEYQQAGARAGGVCQWSESCTPELHSSSPELGEMGLAQRGPEEEGRSLGKTCVRRKHFEKSQGTLRMVGSQRQGISRTGTEERRREPHSLGGRKTGEWGFRIFCLLALEPFALINILFSFRLVCFVGWPHCSQSRSFWDENCVNFPHYCICSPGSSVGHRADR